MLASSIERSDSICVDKNESWMDLIKVYLKNEILPMDKRQANKIKK